METISPHSAKVARPQLISTLDSVRVGRDRWSRSANRQRTKML